MSAKVVMSHAEADAQPQLRQPVLTLAPAEPASQPTTGGRRLLRRLTISMLNAQALGSINGHFGMPASRMSLVSNATKMTAMALTPTSRPERPRQPIEQLSAKRAMVPKLPTAVNGRSNLREQEQPGQGRHEVKRHAVQSGQGGDQSEQPPQKIRYSNRLLGHASRG